MADKITQKEIELPKKRAYTSDELALTVETVPPNSEKLKEDLRIMANRIDRGI